MLSANTKAILLLTAPLIVGRGKGSADLLQPREYKNLTVHLRQIGKQPADLLTADANRVLEDCHRVIDRTRLERLLGRGFLMSQAVERWHTRAIWVVSRADRGYPRRLKARLKEDSPAVLYGCGEKQILDAGGLAVVGSRSADDALLEFARRIGHLAATARRTLVSGGAKGIDRAAMRGALESGGTVTGVLADSLEKSSMSREDRNLILEAQLVLVSPYDPSAGFNVGHAMRRNKIVYALADAALVVSADLNKGGTWAGATEQLDKLHLVPVYVRSTGETGKGLEALRSKGAVPWPDPQDAAAFVAALCPDARRSADSSAQTYLSFAGKQQIANREQVGEPTTRFTYDPGKAVMDSALDPAGELFEKVRTLILQILEKPRNAAAVATALGVTKRQAEEWLRRLVEEGILHKRSKPSSYAVRDADLFKGPYSNGRDADRTGSDLGDD